MCKVLDEEVDHPTITLSCSNTSVVGGFELVWSEVSDASNRQGVAT